MYDSHALGSDVATPHADSTSEEEEEEESVESPCSDSHSDKRGPGDLLPPGPEERLETPPAPVREEVGRNQEDSDRDSGSSSSPEELEDLSLDNKSHRPFRDTADNLRGREQSVKEPDGDEGSTRSQSYLDPSNQAAVRQLVRASVGVQQRHQRKHSRAKREWRQPTKGGHRARKANRDAVRQALCSSSVW